MAPPDTTRGRARAAMLNEIKQRAVSQLATEGAAQLSLRAIARDLGMVSSGLYRYYNSRDELLTALIVDAYLGLATAIEAADPVPRRRSFRRRWEQRCQALRSWALAHPEQFQLIYGSPVPGYRAPVDTVQPAGAVVAALLGVVGEAAGAGTLRTVPTPRNRALTSQLREAAAAMDLPMEPGQTSRAVSAFATMIGLVTLELGGHFVGSFEPADRVYAHALSELADNLGF